MDQAETLRQKMMNLNKTQAKAIAVVSGKGGVGKSNFSINFASELAAKGNSVLLMDMDIGMGNVHILLGASSEKNILHYLEGDGLIEDVIVKVEGGFSYISGGSGLNKMVEWKDIEIQRLMDGFMLLQQSYDYLIFDMGAGASENGLELIMSADEVIVITTGEPTSIMDAYSMMKFIHMRDPEKSFALLCNRVMNPAEGKLALNRLSSAMNKFLQKEVRILGSLPEDPYVRRSVINQTPFTKLYPNSPASKTLKNMVHAYLEHNNGEVHNMKTRFTERLSAFFRKK
ncbi:MinD/ParA family protein [Jeotgalibacillus haloalkalitolerans]|uniref:MinD/ParA family protein n=1 Tax=Jeotgalibacillus haloalkalitolerans TaxID=3104292 RepID=A0ABU5KKF2_9BACL|nr:MinD/ParA family protein [Jeotgalibacillus sp. HH7-29]MDZ5711739.1 MinD/ParA family protein [Jeotgalibacillus sp. HH7-29]